MAISYKLKGKVLIIRNRFGNVHIEDSDENCRLMWITARSKRHADRLIAKLHWNIVTGPGHVRSNEFDYKKKRLVSKLIKVSD